MEKSKLALSFQEGREIIFSKLEDGSFTLTSVKTSSKVGKISFCLKDEKYLSIDGDGTLTMLVSTNKCAKFFWHLLVNVESILLIKSQFESINITKNGLYGINNDVSILEKEIIDCQKFKNLL